jgi:hypothetical protein
MSTNIVSVGHFVATEPFSNNSAKVKHQSMVAVVDQRQTLTPLKVVFGNPRFSPGQLIFVEGEQCTSVWAKRIYQSSEHIPVPFILVPEELIRLSKFPEPPALTAEVHQSTSTDYDCD